MRNLFLLCCAVLCLSATTPLMSQCRDDTTVIDVNGCGLLSNTAVNPDCIADVGFLSRLLQYVSRLSAVDRSSVLRLRWKRQQCP